MLPKISEQALAIEFKITNQMHTQQLMKALALLQEEPVDYASIKKRKGISPPPMFLTKMMPKFQKCLNIKQLIALYQLKGCLSWKRKPQ